MWQQLTDAPNTETIVRILWFLSPHATIIPHQDVVTRILPLLTHTDSLVRRTALQIIFGCSAEIAIEEFIRGPWAWSSTNHKEENHWGSLILCEHGHQLPFLDILRRVHPVYLGHAVCCRGNKTEEIEVYADALHQQWLRLGTETPNVPVDFPPISIETFPTNDHITHFHRYRLEKHDQEPITFSNDSWGGENETYVSGLGDMMSEDADARWQEQRQESAHRVKETIEQQLAEGNTWFAHRFFPDALEQVVHIRPDLVEQWVAGVWNEQPEAIRRLQLGSTFYEALCETLLEVSSEQGTRLYWHLQTVPKYVFTRDSRSGIELLDYALFRSQPTEAIQQNWNKRLEQCRTDQELLQVTIAAQAGRGQDWLQSYINRALQSEVPITQMRAMTLLGLTDTEANVEQLGELRTQMPDTWKRELVDTSLDRSQRNMWAKHWFRRFLTVPNDVEAWAAFGLFLRCVDQRFWLWYEHIVAEIESDDVLSPRVRFLEENMDTINNKVKKNQDTIKKQFLGQKVKRGEMWPWMR